MNGDRRRDRRRGSRRRSPGHDGVGRPARRSTSLRIYRTAAERRLRRFRRGSALAVGLTGLLLLVTGAPEVTTGAAAAVQIADTLPADTVPDAAQAVEEATGTLRELAAAVSAFLPKLVIALLILAAAGLLVALLRPLLRRMLRSWSRGVAASAGIGILIWILAIGTALAVITGDARTLLGSVGLLGLALSWALQAPIESFTAWVLNSFREYYRVGDRIAVGDVFGDIHRIDFLTTTVWEASRPDAGGLGGGPTGGMITFPNSEVLRSNIVNYTRDFPWVWDEITVGVANESDLRYALERARDVAESTVGEQMRGPAAAYRALLRRAGIDVDVPDAPQVFLGSAPSWMNISVRYLVPARTKRFHASALLLALTEELAQETHGTRIRDAYPLTRVQMVDDR